ncbi:MAG: NADH-quinone oxidoreductase subunit M [Myxococcaceae bacterium]|nr:NADH-quinone oxidoreductase subunit M [Myxococcaceae bacterium]MCI0671132.1 NADH-quinone oxidoreductase subunit M [Myxococcaceae bacterium]
MSFLDTHLLSFIVFLPLVFAGVLAMLPREEHGELRVFSLIAMLTGAALGVYAYLRFDPAGPEFQLLYRARWFDEAGISYHVGVDGIAVSLLMLTAFLGPLVVLASWSFVTERVKEFHIALLVLQTMMLGAVVSLDLLLFYVFFEGMLIPMYLLVGVWGSEDRQMAATKFFVYTLGGSLLMLIALLGVYFIAMPAGSRTFDYATVYNAFLSANRELGACRGDPAACATLSPLAVTLRTWGPWMFGACVLAYAIKVPMFPVHTWLPDAHVQAPVAGSIILAGVMLKMGTFGFWRFAFPLFPAATQEFRVALAAISVVGIVYGALMCLAQRDVKKLIAYSSVSHLGFCMLGMLALTVEGATGSAYQMLNHGVSTGALFLLFGFLYERRHTRLMSDYGGIARVMPLFTAAFLVATFSSIAVPPTNGFVGEFLVLLGTFKSDLSLVLAVLASTGVILGAAYMLWMVQKVFFGQVTHGENQGLKDLGGREVLTALPFVALVLVMGLRPQPFLERLEPSARRLVARANVARPGAASPDAELLISALPLPPAGGTVAKSPEAPPRLPLRPARLATPPSSPSGAPEGVRVAPASP